VAGRASDVAVYTVELSGVKMPRGHKNAVANGEIGIPIVFYWSEAEICRMDTKFTDAMMTAIAAGLEQCTIGVRTASGTKRPIINYRRPD
jgi:hypothetical protein